MKQLIITLFFLISALALNAKIDERSIRSVGVFNEIEISQNIIVYISEGVETVVEIEADEEIESSIITEVHNGVLKIGVNDMYKRELFKKSSFVVYITIDKFKKLSTNTSSRVYILSVFSFEDLQLIATTNSSIILEEKFSANNVQIETSGLAKIKSKSRVRSKASNVKIAAHSESEIELDIDVDERIECSATNSAKIIMSGKAIDGLLSATTSSELKMRNFEIDSVNAVATTKAQIQFRVNKMMAATASNAIISYSGKPTIVSKETSLGGKIR